MNKMAHMVEIIILYNKKIGVLFTNTKLSFFISRHGGIFVEVSLYAIHRIIADNL